MMIKYRVREVAKDLDIPNKDVIDTLAKYFPEPKKYMTALNEEELDKVSALFSLEGQSLKDKMRAVMVRFSLEALIVTVGKNGAAYLDQAGFGISLGIPTSVKFH